MAETDAQMPPPLAGAGRLPLSLSTFSFAFMLGEAVPCRERKYVSVCGRARCPCKRPYFSIYLVFFFSSPKLMHDGLRWIVELACGCVHPISFPTVWYDYRFWSMKWNRRCLHNAQKINYGHTSVAVFPSFLFHFCLVHIFLDYTLLPTCPFFCSICLAPTNTKIETAKHRGLGL